MCRRLLPLAFLLILMFSGCRDYREISSTTFVAGAAVDLADDGSYLLTAEIIDFANTDIEQGLKTHLLEASGESVGIAAQRLSAQVGNTLYWSHAETFIVSRDVAERGCGSLVDFLLYNVDTGLTTTLLLADTERAADLLSLDSRDSGVLCYDLQKLLTNAEWYADTIPLHLYRILDDLYKPSSCGIVGVIGSVEQGESAYPVLLGTAAFRQMRLLSEFDAAQTQLYALLQGKSPDMRVPVTLSDGTPYTVEVASARLKRDTAPVLVLSAVLSSEDVSASDGDCITDTVISELEQETAHVLGNALMDFAVQNTDILDKDVFPLSVTVRISSITHGPGAPIQGVSAPVNLSNPGG